jgi:hypothetical protein
VLFIAEIDLAIAAFGVERVFSIDNIGVVAGSAYEIVDARAAV